MIQHNDKLFNRTIYYKYNDTITKNPYGVSSIKRLLSPQALLKHFDQVRQFMTDSLKLTTGQREVVFRLLKLWCYYGKVYSKENQITELPGCKKATFWRTIAILKHNNLVTVVNRYIKRDQAQISNLYILDKLILAIAKYLAEKGAKIHDFGAIKELLLPGSQFWQMIFTREFILSPPPPTT
jgi:hypothetical protein